MVRHKDIIVRVIISICVGIAFLFAGFYILNFHNILLVAEGEVKCGISTVCFGGPISLFGVFVCLTLIFYPIILICLFEGRND